MLDGCLRAACDEMLMMSPIPRSFIGPIAALHVYSVARKLRSSTCR